jgi:hypothetical protein
MSAELTFRNQVGEQIVRISQGVRPNFSRCQAERVAGRAVASNVGGTGYVLSGCGRSGAAFSKLRFLGVIGAKLRAKVLPGGRAPDFHVAIAGTERLAAEHAAARAAAHEIPAAREHRNLSTNLGSSMVRRDSLMRD